MCGRRELVQRARPTWRAAALAVLWAGVACGPERPPAPGSFAAATPSPATHAGRKDLPASAYRVEWGPLRVLTLAPGERVEIAVTVKNAGTTPWPASGKAELYVVRLGHRWLRANGELVADFGERRVELPGVVAPGGSVSVGDTLVAPTRKGDYVVQFDLVHEGVTWFSERGAAKQFVSVHVR